MSFAQAMSALVMERSKLILRKQESQIISSLSSYYEDIIHVLNIKISKYISLIISQLKGNTNVSVDDSIGAYMVFPKNRAHNIASHASAFDCYEKKYAVEVLFDKYMIEVEGVYGLPNVKIDNLGNVIVSVIPSNDLRKEFLYPLFVKQKIELSVRLEHQTIKDIDFFLDKLNKLFRSFDNTITERDVYVFIHLLLRDKLDEFEFAEATRVENKINNLFIGNRNYYLFLALLHYLKILGYILNADNLSKSLGAFFKRGTSLKVSTISKYLSEKDKWEILENEYYPKMKNICFDY